MLFHLLRLITLDVYNREEQEMIARAPGPPKEPGIEMGLPSWLLIVLAVCVIAVITSKALL